MSFDTEAVILLRRLGDLIRQMYSTTRVADFAGQAVNAGEWFTVVEESGRGILREFHIRSPSTDFKISVVADGTTILEKTYNELRQIEQNSPDISAFAELDEDGNTTGYYVISIRNIYYYTSILIKVQNIGPSPLTFNQLFAKYHIVVK